MLKDRNLLEETLAEIIHEKKLKAKRSRITEDIKKHLQNQYNITNDEITKIVLNPKEELPKLDARKLFLFSEQVYSKTGNLEINPEDYFSEVEIQEARQFSGVIERQESNISFPMVVSNATIVGNSAYMVTLDIKVINQLLNNQMLHYDFNLQREAKFTKNKDIVRIEPTLNLKNVREIEEHLLQGTLVPTVLVFNAAIRSSEEGTELIFDPKKMELTITNGTKLAIVDGYHRCRASQNALQVNPDLNFNFAVLITNYSTKMAQQYQAQLAKATPISKTRIQELEANRFSDTIVQQLKTESDLQGRISQTNRIHSLNRELVTYNVLADTIDEQFKLNTRADAADAGDYLTEFFNFLIGSYSEEFIDNVEETRKKSFINDNNMFIGYVVLGRRMFEENISAKEIRKIMKTINFDKTNPIWKSSNVIDNEGRILDTLKWRKFIKEYFETIDI